MKTAKKVLCILLCLSILVPLFASCATEDGLSDEIQTESQKEGDSGGNKDNDTPNNKEDNSSETPLNPTEGLSYTELPDGTYEVSVGEATNEETIVIPATYEGKAVTKIAENGFRGAQMVNIQLPNSITMIGTEAFYECMLLIVIVIPNSVTEIGERAFSKCDALTTLTLPSDIVNVAENAFENTNIKDATIPASMMPLFQNTNLEILVINGGESVGYGELFVCRSLKNLTIGDSVTRLNYGAFAFGDHLITLVIAPTVTEIDMNAFIECDHIISAILPTWALKTIHSPALETITFNAGTTIDGEVIDSYQLSNLKSVTIGNSVTSISENAFSGCSSLTEISIPVSVTNIGRDAFSNCTSLEIIHFMGTKAQWDAIEKNNIGLSSSVTIQPSITPEPEPEPEPDPKPEPKPEGTATQGLQYTALSDGTYEVSVGTARNEKNIIIPAIYEGKVVTRIAEYGFSGCSELIDIEIPNGITGIGYYAFQACSSLNKVVVPNTVTWIGEKAFYNCSEMRSVTIGTGVERINDKAFDRCNKLIEVINNSSLNFEIGSSNNGYISYNAIEIHNGTSKIISAGDYLFYTCNGTNYLLGYTGNDTELTLPVDYNGQNYEIARCAFYNRDDLTRVTIPNGVVGIRQAAFYNCDGLTEMIIPDTVRAIWQSAFYNCSELKSVTLGTGLIEIADMAFAYCYKLVEVVNNSSWNLKTDSNMDSYMDDYTIEVHSGTSKIVHQNGYLFYTYNGVNYLVGYEGSDTVLTLPATYNGQNYEVNKYAFYNSNKLTSVTIPNSIAKIGRYAFQNCSELTNVILGNGIDCIDYEVFYKCTKLKTITIPNTITKIYENAFAYDSALTDIYYSGTEEEWKAISKSSANIPQKVTVHYNYVPSNS